MKNVFFVVITCLIILGCDSNTTPSAPAFKKQTTKVDKTNSISIRPIVIASQIKGHEKDMFFPELYNLEDLISQKKINQKLTPNVLLTYDNMKIKQATVVGNNKLLSSYYTVNYNMNNVLDLCYSYSYLNASNKEYFVVNDYTFSLNTGELLVIDNFVKKNMKADLQKLVEQRMQTYLLELDSLAIQKDFPALYKELKSITYSNQILSTAHLSNMGLAFRLPISNENRPLSAKYKIDRLIIPWEKVAFLIDPTSALSFKAQ